jgi:hypothetical protein
MLPPEQHTRVLDPVVPANWLMGMVETWLPWTIVALALVVYLVISGARRGKNG